MRLLVTGSAGMLGSAVKVVFNGHDLILTDKTELDVRLWDECKDYIELEFYNGIDFILHLAAETDLELCEKDPNLAYTTNTIGTVNMRNLAEMLDIPIIYISTSGIFDGEQHYYYEYDTPNPNHHYGRSKLYGEYALNTYKKVYIFRASWMIGGGFGVEKKFLGKIFNQIKAGKTELYAHDDTTGNPTYTYDLARTIKKALEEKLPYGTYNAAGEGFLTRYTMAERFIKYLGLHNVRLHKADPNIAGEIKRSKSEVLFNTKLKHFGASCMRHYDETLKEYAKCFIPFLPSQTS